MNPVSTLFSFFLVYCFVREVTAGQISTESFFFFVDIKLLWPQNLFDNLDGLPDKENKI